MKERLIKWAYGLVGGCIGGGAASVMSWLGMTTAKAIGIDVPQLNFKACGVIFLSGVVTHAMAYLSKSPLPPLNGDTTTFTRTETVSVKEPQQKEETK